MGMVSEFGVVVSVVKIILLFLSPFNNMFYICILNVKEVFVALQLFPSFKLFHGGELSVRYFELVHPKKGPQSLLCQFTLYACMSSGICTSVRFRISFP